MKLEALNSDMLLICATFCEYNIEGYQLLLSTNIEGYYQLLSTNTKLVSKFQGHPGDAFDTEPTSFLGQSQ